MNLEEIRLRHSHCITNGQIQREYLQGRIPESIMAKGHMKATCSYWLEDGFCAAPNVPIDKVIEFLSTVPVKKRGRPKKVTA